MSDALFPHPHGEQTALATSTGHFPPNPADLLDRSLRAGRGS